MAKSVADYQTAFQNFMEKGARYYACPTGTMLPFAGKTVPAGFLLCNGAEISRTTYARLFSVLGTTWGAGNGSTTFNLPNVNDRCLEGTTNTANVGKYLEAGLPDITGNLYAGWMDASAAGLVLSDIPEHRFGALFPMKTSNSLRTTYAEGGYTDTSGAYFNTIGFQAKKSDSRYGRTTAIQPYSFQILMIVKH